MVINWDNVKKEYAAGAKLKDLAKKYVVSIDTLRSRHRRENWSELRTKTEQKTNNRIIEEVANIKVEQDLDEIESIIKSIKKIDELIDLGNIEACSLEGLLDKKVKLLVVLGSYTGKTQERKEINSNINLSNDELYKLAIEAAQNIQKENISKRPNS